MDTAFTAFTATSEPRNIQLERWLSTATESESAMFPTSEFRPRRGHEKSRKGCLRCKQQRKKCDEILPSCSRCVTGGHACKYADSRSAPRSTEGRRSEEQQAEPSSRLDVPSPHIQTFSGRGSSSPMAFSDSVSSASSASPFGSMSPFGSLSPFPIFSETEERHIYADAPATLDATELSLLSHYITHTSRVIPCDQTDDGYALQVGLPNVAFSNRPLMASILGLSATCRCYDIARHSPEPLESSELRNLLVVADQHHNSSLQQIRAAIPNKYRYEYVLLNAILMAVYGIARHSVRIRLAEIAKPSNRSLPNELLPTGTQWIILLRAAHSANLRLPLQPEEIPDTSIMASFGQRTSDIFGLDTSPGPGIENMAREFGLPKPNIHLLFPIVAATFSSALEHLNTQAQYVEIEDTFPVSVTGTMEESGNWQQQSASLGSERQACHAALEVLGDTFARVFRTSDSTPTSPEVIIHELPLSYPDASTPSWLKSYLDRITTRMPSTPIRRLIMGFINLVPAEFINLVQPILNNIPIGVDCEDSLPWETSTKSLPSSSTHRLAMNIFAHWLVLLMLLDDVWWARGMGEWELRRAVWFMQSQGWFDLSVDNTDRWWPESMLRVKRELAKHTEE